ncbi:unnamed protein product [Linum trigynum]|uniref:F-box domain-containing protein n=1 Tax=Linum trigynum TaxID=586398 RepID=A0AAV2CTK3_9ROSI
MAVVWLPDEIVTGIILYRLPIRSLLKFRSVCKHRQSVIDGSEFAHRYLRHSAASWDVVICLVREGDNLMYSIFHLIDLRLHDSPTHVTPEFYFRPLRQPAAANPAVESSVVAIPFPSINHLPPRLSRRRRTNPLLRQREVAASHPLRSAAATSPQLCCCGYRG